jgi:hypothetical protein
VVGCPKGKFDAKKKRCRVGTRADAVLTPKRNPDSDNKPSDFKVGERVQTHPATDAWMRGDRYGTVSSIGHRYVFVRMDRSGRELRFHPRNLIHENPGRDSHRKGPSAGTMWERINYPRHVARVVNTERAKGGLPPMVNLEIVSASGREVYGVSRVPVNVFFAEYQRRETNPKKRRAAKRGRRNPTLVHQGLATKPTFHLLDKAGRAVADLYGVNLERAKRVAQTIADATGMSVEIKEATGSSVYGAARAARALSSAKPRLSNPGADTATLEQAGKTFRKWHGFDPGNVTRLSGSRTIPHVLVALGRVPEIVYESNKWKGKLETYVHKTGRPKPLLATGPDGQGLYIVGGKVKVTPDGLVG